MSVRTLRLTRRGWALAWASFALLVVATILNRREGLFVAVFLILLTVLCAASVASQRVPLRIVRRVAGDGRCGDPLDVVCEVHGGGSLAAVSGWTDSVPRSFGHAPAGVLPPEHLTRAGRVDVRYSVVPSVRGRYDLGPFRLSVADPLGVCEAAVTVGDATSVLVLPRVSSLAPGDLIATTGEGRRQDRMRPTAPRADELIARDYRPGDPLRRVHWRATARHGQLMVRQEEPQADPEALVLLDVAPGQKRIDALVDMAASVAVHLSTRGYRMTIADSRDTWVDAPPKDPRELLTALAVWPGDALGSGDELGRRIERRFSDRIPVIVLTADIDRLSDLGAVAMHAAPALAFVATGSGLSAEEVPEPWLASGLADRLDVSASWDRLNRRRTHV